MPRRLMLFAATTGYQTRVFAGVARRLGIEVGLATDRCKGLDDPWGDHSLPVRFGQTGPSLALLDKHAFDAVVAVGDLPTVLAAEAAERKGIRFHPAAAVRACHNKFLARQHYVAAGLPVPWFFSVPLADGPDAALAKTVFPCVLKPLGLAGSRGVIRADDASEFRAAYARIRALLESPEVKVTREEQNRYLQVEGYIEGREFAVEGIVTRGSLRVLAIFDKPDPLRGPFFEETIYTTPSREPAPVQEAISATVARAVGALGLRHGPVHAEVRVNDRGIWMLETAARPIGGLCAKALTFDGGTALEELIVRHALGEDVSAAKLDGPASGVMMIPIPRGGVYEGVSGIERAAAVPGIDEVVVTAKEGQKLVPLPEGASYLGFIFARGESPEQVEQSLRAAHANLEFRIAGTLPTIHPRAAV